MPTLAHSLLSWCWPNRRPARKARPRSRTLPDLRFPRRPLIEELESRTLLSGNTLADAILLHFAANQAAAQGSLDHGAVFYAVSITGPGRLTAQVHAAGSPTRLSLLDETGAVLVQSDGQSPANPDDLIDLHVTGNSEGTTYYLEVQGPAGAAGPYDLQADFATAAPPFQSIAAGDQSRGHAFDLNGDGVPDLVLANFQGGDVSVLLGRGDGTFAPEVRYPVGLGPSDLIAVAPRPGAAPDLVTANYDGTIAVLPGNGDGTFGPATQIALGLFPSALVAGDFNGDGNADLAVADAGTGEVAVLTGNGDGTFSAPTYYAAGSGACAIVAADLDHDGHPDLATANQADNSVSVLLGNGDGTFQPARSFAVGQGPCALVVGDFTGDGRFDLATANAASNTVSVLLSDGNGSFVAAAPLATGRHPTGLVAADFHNDGRLDLAVTNQQDGTLSVFAGRGDGTFAAPTTVTVGATPSFLVAADFNHDGSTDLAHGDADGHVFIDLGRGNGTFQVLPPVAREPAPRGTAVGDFNRDGIPDMAVSDVNSGDVQILYGRDDGTFRIGPRYAVGSQPYCLTAADLGRDGILDLIVTDLAGNDVAILMGRGDGTFSAPAYFPAGATPIDVVVGDFNGDGHLDLAVADAGTNTVAVLLGQGDGTFSAPQEYAVGSAPISLAVGDFTGDGHPDLAVANYASDDVSVLPGNGDGTFAPEVRYAVGAAPYAIVAGDFDGDGHLDLATANSGDNTASVLLGQPGGAFAPQVTFAAGLSPTGLAVADLNGDGRLDLAVSNADGVCVLSGQGQGAAWAFSQGAQVAAGSDPLTIVAGDFNGDGRPDLAAANFNSDDVSVLLNAGGGTFQGQLRTPVPGGSSAVVQDDLANDGNADLVTTNFNAGTVSVRLGRGNGTFQDPINYAVGSGPDALVAADFNGDGRDDLAVANFLDGTVSVLLGLGDGTLQSQQVYKVGREPDAIVAGDFNGDGIPDLAVANYGGGTVTVLLGRRGGTFAAPVTVPVGAGPDALAVADVGGTPGLVVGDYLSRDVTVLLGDGRGHFGAGTVAPLPAGPASVVTGDFNGDGVPDVVVACPADGGIFLLTGERLVTGGPAGYALQAPRPVATAVAPVALVASDFNNDGRLDLGYADNGDNSVGISLGQGDGTFQVPQTHRMGSYPFGLAAGDFNSDGRLDLATANGLGQPVSVCLGLGDGTCADVAEASAPVQSAPVVADLNGDGVPDVVVLRQDGKILFRPGLVGQASAFGPPVVINPDLAWAARHIVVGRVAGMNMLLAVNARSNSDAVYADLGGHFVRLAAFDLPTELPSYLIGGDVNGDGLPDLVLASAATGQIFVGLQRPSEDLFYRPWDYQLQVTPGISGVALVDLNGDGLPDIVVTNQVTGAVDVLVNSQADPFATRLHFRSGTGLTAVQEYDDSYEVRSGDTPVAMVAGLFDGGTVPDLAVLNQGADRVDLLRADGQGGLLNPDPAASLVTGPDPVAIVTGDFNGDGHPDLAVLNKGSGDISVFLGDGHGHFTETLVTGPDGQPARLGAGNAPTGLAAADLTGDGKLDLLVSNAQGDVLTLVGNGDGTFQPYRRLDDHVALAVADVNGDGRQEVVFADASLDRVRLLSDQPGQDFVQGRQDGVLKPNAVKLADLNGDGVPDLIVANGGGNDVLVYPGLGDGRFGPAHTFFVGTDPTGLTVADLTGDGVPDLVVANQGSNDVSVLFGQGRGAGWTLVPGPRLAAGWGPVATAVADVNGNGTPDILVANSQSDNVYLLRGLGGGFFDDAHPVVFPTGLDPEAIFAGNFDGRLDLVTVNAGSNDLTLFSGFGPGRSLPSGGLGPVAAVMGDFNHSGFDDLVVANADGRFALLMGGAEGPQVATVLSRADLLNPSDMALGAADGRGVDVYVTTDGNDAATQLTFAVGPATAPDGLLQPAAPVPGAGEVSALPELPLGLVMTLVLGGNSEATAAPTSLPAGESSAADVSPSGAASVVSPAVWITFSDDAGEESIRGAVDVTAGGAPGEAAINLNAFITGAAEVSPAQRLAGQGQGLGSSPPALELFDFSDVPAGRGQRQGDRREAGPAPAAGAIPESNDPGPAAPVEPGQDGASPAAESVPDELEEAARRPGRQPEVAARASIPTYIWGLAVGLVQAIVPLQTSRKSRQDEKYKARPSGLDSPPGSGERG
jgi:hypothetical protein